MRGDWEIVYTMWYGRVRHRVKYCYVSYMDPIHPHPSLVLFVVHTPGLIGRQAGHNEKGRFVACTHGLIARQSDYKDNGRFVAYMPSLIDMQSGYSEEGRFVVYTRLVSLTSRPTIATTAGSLHICLTSLPGNSVIVRKTVSWATLSDSIGVCS